MTIAGPGIGAATSVLTKVVPFYVRFSRETWTDVGNAVAEIFNADDAAVRLLQGGGSVRQAREALPSDARRTHYARLFSRARDERVIAGRRGRSLARFVEVGMDFTWQQLLLSDLQGSPSNLERVQEVALERERAQQRLAALGGLAAFERHRQASLEGAGPDRPADAEDLASGATSQSTGDSTATERALELQQHMSACGELLSYLDKRERFAR